MYFDETYTVPKMFRDSADKYAELPAQMKRLPKGDFEPILYRDTFSVWT